MMHLVPTRIVGRLHEQSERRDSLWVKTVEDEVGLTYMVKLEMKAEDGRSTSKAASLVMGSWFQTELWMVVTA